MEKAESRLHQDSLILTLEAVNDARLFGSYINQTESKQIANWIAGRIDQPGGYGSLPAPTEKDYHEYTRLWTGEKLHSRASFAHITGEEACRTMILLNPDSKKAIEGLNYATGQFIKNIDRNIDEGFHRPGKFCCCTCSPAYWRHLAAGGLRNQEEEIKAGMRWLKTFRTNDSGWKTFPFYWTVSALVEIGSPAREEIAYAAPRLERLVAKKTGDNIVDQRRQKIAEKALKLL